MQAEYFGFNQGPPQGFIQQQQQPNFVAPPSQFNGYSFMPPQIRNLDRIRKGNRYNKNFDGRKLEGGEFVNSTDESIHLVRSRKTGGEGTSSRHEDQKKRSQSGNSISKNSDNLQDAVLQKTRSQSEDRIISNNDNSGERTASSAEKSSSKNKRRKERRNRKYNYSDDRYAPDQMYYTNQQQGGYYDMQCYPVQADDYYHQQQYAADQNQYLSGYQGGYAHQGYEQAPGGPLDYNHQYMQQQYDSNYVQQYYQQHPETTAYSGISNAPSGRYGSNSQSQMFIPTSGECPQPNNIPGLPPGAKLVAEYFIGYLDENQPNPTCVQPPPQVQPQQHYVPSSHSSKEEIEIELWEKSSRKKKEKKHIDSGDDTEEHEYEEEHHHHHHHEEEEEKREKKKPEQKEREKEREKERRRRRDDDDESDNKAFRNLKEDIISIIQKELSNLRLQESKQSDPIQPIFLMPKSSEQAQSKPIYIPRNIYVPVIRPVFVPRERIIVRPQIIHVARPVLVDRPVPIQQRPIVIERDRPVPVRVETIERTESVGASNVSSGNVGVETARNVETTQEVTYHEFTQNYPSTTSQVNVDYNTTQSNTQQAYDYSSNTSNNYQYQSDYQSEENRRKQDVYNILDDAERRKQNLQSKSNEDIVAQYKYVKYDSGSDNVKALDSMLGNTQGYTLEVLDQRVSDKFEKTDQETIKARYGVDSFQYLPAGVELTSQQNRSASSSFGVTNTNDYYSNVGGGQTQNLGTSSSYKSVLAAANENRTSNLFANYGGDSTTPYGTVTNVAQIPSPGSRGLSNSQAPVVIQNVQKMIQNFGNFPSDQNPSIIIEN